MSRKAIPTDLETVVANALAEDVGPGDITAQLIDADAQATAKIIAREKGVLCGAPWADAVFRKLAANMDLQWLMEDGDDFDTGQVLVKIQGNARAILSGERTALNFLQTLSGTATQTRALLTTVQHTNVTLLDTRKTLPGLRTAQKYAVATGGGSNHRMGLYDAFLIKENHIASCGGIEAAVARARKISPGKTVEIEVQSLAELDQALEAGADIVMLDNFSLEATSQAVEHTNKRAKLEASGGIDKDTLVRIAETGVDYISVGALTKHCRAVDLSLLMD
ncbi:MAG: carboxylating nicotinate-nucleotide diphosphorylase [Gammaproteobacteria bacterium]